MPPKIRIEKEAILRAALDLVREQGEPSLNARNLAMALGCSTQPIFSNFATMEELRRAVIEEAYALYRRRIDGEMARGEFPPYKASGMAYIAFAEEERELFRLLFMRDRRGEPMGGPSDEMREMSALLRKNVGLNEEEASLFHVEMWMYVHGIATVIATGYQNFDREMISRMLSDAYMGLKKRYEEKE